MKKKDLTNQRFGRLTVIQEDPVPYRFPSGRLAHRWACVCDCGNHLSVDQKSLISGRTKSCGCLKTKVDLTNQKFGKLTVIGKDPVQYRMPSGELTRRWICRCDCGNQVTVHHSHLLSGNTKSCGCERIKKSTERISADGINVFERFEGTSVSSIKPERKLRKDNTSGVRGVYWDKRAQKWYAAIGVQGRQIRIGTFQNIEDAEKARTDAEEKFFTPIIERWEKEQNKGKEESVAC